MQSHFLCKVIFRNAYANIIFFELTFHNIPNVLICLHQNIWRLIIYEQFPQFYPNKTTC